MKRYGTPKVIVTDRLRSYGAAMKVIGNADRQEVGRRKNNRAENSHLPFRRRERAMLRFRRMRSLQKFVAIHSSIHNHFNQERHLYSRQNFKLNRSAALTEWRQLCSASILLYCRKLRLVRINLMVWTAPPTGIAMCYIGAVFNQDKRRGHPNGHYNTRDRYRKVCFSTSRC